MLKFTKGKMINYTCMMLFGMIVLCNGRVCALEPQPDKKIAMWGSQAWGIVRIIPHIIRYGNQIHIHGILVGPGPAAIPFWSCSQYSAWTANGTSSISIAVPKEWDMPNTGTDIFGNKVNLMRKDGGDPPPYGWENRISDTCYCYITDFGAAGGCESLEVQPDLFYMMDQWNPREGNVQFATVQSGSGWTGVSVTFGGYAGVSWSDWATGYVYVVSNESQLNEDSDHDGLPDAWEYAHSLTLSLDDFEGGNIVTPEAVVLSDTEWVNPYAPSEPGWVSAGPNDWDGDGVSNKDEYLKWKNNKRDGDGWPYDPTFINYGTGCPVTTALQDEARDGDIATLRQFRDKVLRATPTGREIIRLYYALSPIIVEAMEEDQEFAKQVKDMIDVALELIRSGARSATP